MSDDRNALAAAHVPICSACGDSWPCGTFRSATSDDAPSRHQHDTLDQIREHLAAIIDRSKPRPTYTRPNYKGNNTYQDAVAALAKFDALLAEGRTLYIHPAAREGVTTSFTAFGIDPTPYGHKDFAPCLVIPLLVGVGCGNAKKGTP